MSISSKKFKFYLWVGLTWLSLWLLNSLVNYPETFFARSLNKIWESIFVTTLNFILFEFTIPFIKLTWKRILLGLLIIWVHAMMYSFGLQAWTYFGKELHIYSAIDALSNPSKAMAYCTGSIFFFGIIKHIHNYINLKQVAQKLQIEKQDAELNYLKSQTNPHFLFNTLNNIYSLSRDKSDLAPESILRLSKILRFMLYETGGDFISVEHEIELISDYIALEKMRYDDTLRINFKQEIDDLKQPLPPLLLIPLIENAFKHGVSETNNNPFVDITLSIRKQQFLFFVENSTENSIVEKKVKENIGLSNLRRQLELLYTEYNLNVAQKETIFTATLKINLASHV